MEFQPIELKHRYLFRKYFAEDPPQCSEFTFTNLFIWRHKYRPLWTTWENLLLILVMNGHDSYCAFMPIGKGDKAAAISKLVSELSNRSQEPQICRVDRPFVENFVDLERYKIEEDRNNYDYVYLSEDLIRLNGNKYRKKRNTINQFTKNFEHEYRVLDESIVDSVLRLQNNWCEFKGCNGNFDLMNENIAVREALSNFRHLGIRGGAILIDAGVEAFSLGELLNANTAVIHIEKANPGIPGLYSAINQRFLSNSWSETLYVNQEQDLGIEGLRHAKQQYHPTYLVEKYILTPK
jgi:uncharacterized protein